MSAGAPEAARAVARACAASWPSAALQLPRGAPGAVQRLRGLRPRRVRRQGQHRRQAQRLRGRHGQQVQRVGPQEIGAAHQPACQRARGRAAHVQRRAQQVRPVQSAAAARGDPPVVVHGVHRAGGQRRGRAAQRRRQKQRRPPRGEVQRQLRGEEHAAGQPHALAPPKIARHAAGQLQRHAQHALHGHDKAHLRKVQPAGQQHQRADAQQKAVAKAAQKEIRAVPPRGERAPIRRLPLCLSLHKVRRPFPILAKAPRPKGRKKRKAAGRRFSRSPQPGPFLHTFIRNKTFSHRWC